MLSPPEHSNTLLFIFFSFFFLTECSILNDPTSTIICMPGETLYNVTLAKDINAGVFTAIHKAKTMPQCIRESCNRRAGQIAFLIEDSCFMVSCFRKEYCQTVPSETPNSLRVAVTRYTFFDAAPVFQHVPRTLYVTENNRVGKHLIDIFAYAKSRISDNTTVYFNITRGNIGNAFKIIQRPERGGASLIANTVLDRESISYYYLVIQATNIYEQKKSTITLRVEVIDTNDNAPRFPTSKPTFPVPIYLATVNESCPLHTEILRVRARMASGHDRGIKYYFTPISGREADSHFAINSVTGAIVLIRKLNFKKEKSYVFLVAAIDVRKASSVDNVLVRIKVEDVNDHRPVFKYQIYNVIYKSEPSLFSTVTRVKATDDDVGKNAELTYYLKGNTKNGKGFFEIDSSTGAIKIKRMLQRESLSLFRMTVSVIDNGTPFLKGANDAQVNVLIFQPFSTPLILIKTTEHTITVQFNLKYLDLTNVDKFGVIVQEYLPSEEIFFEYTELKPLTWFLIHFIHKENQNLRRYISKMVPNTPKITNFGMFQTTVGDEKDCNNKKKAKEICSGPLNPGSKYRFQLRAYLKDSGPFPKYKYKDGDFTEAFFTGLSKAAKTYRKEGRRNYDAVVYSVGAALVLVIVLAFLRGFYRLKLDQIRIHEDKKKQISFPVSNPRFQDPESPVEKIKTPSQGRRLMASITAEKSLETGRSEEDDGSSPDSALDESTRPLQRQRPRLQDIRLKSYFHSVDTESCNSCDGVRVYYLQESTA